LFFFIIEDDANLISSLQAMLSLAGFECQTNNGNVSSEELMGLLRNYLPDFFILDIMLPKIDGFEIVKRIKEDEILKNKPIYVFTSLGDQDSREKGSRLGVDYYLVKADLNADQLVEKIIKTIKNKEKQS
jgi:DNA-binding response OmpR family regulator